jgi:hypothetical protein
VHPTRAQRSFGPEAVEAAVIDSVALVWGHAIGSSARRAYAPRTQDGRRNEALSPPVRLELEQLVERFGSDEGQVTTKRYGDKQPTFGQWQHDGADVLYREGRLEVRGSLPRLVAGRNDVVLDERGVHHGLRELERIATDVAGYKLKLIEAVPTRLDYCWQWQVPSVAWILEHLKASYAPPRKKRNEIVSPKGGRSLVFGYDKGRRTIRFYDKVGELHDRGEESMHDVDTILRYEIQERRRGKLRLVHEHGYTAVDVHRELEHGVAAIAAVAARDVEAVLAAGRDEWSGAVAFTLGALYLLDHEAMFPVLRRVVSRRSYYAWRRRARELQLQVADWTPHIPLDELVASTSLWRDQAAA